VEDAVFTDLQGKPSSPNSDVTTTLALTQPQNRQQRRIRLGLLIFEPYPSLAAIR